MKKVCKVCGAEFDAFRADVKYCCRKCQNIANRIPKTKPDEKNAINLITTRADDWEYIGGYTGSEGSLVIRHKPCGFTTRKSAVTIRHGKKLKCMICEVAERKAKREANQKAKERAREAEQFRKIKPVHYEQESTKPCVICGGFFFGTNKYCSEACQKESERHRWSMKKRRRAKLARTEESKTITLRKLYERDAGVCWICGKPCDYSADPNGDYYPSIDHVQEIANGGRDEWSNIKLAHRLCNSRRWFKESAKAQPVSISPGQKIEVA